MINKNTKTNTGTHKSLKNRGAKSSKFTIKKTFLPTICSIHTPINLETSETKEPRETKESEKTMEHIGHTTKNTISAYKKKYLVKIHI